MTSREALESVREARHKLMEDWSTMTPEQIREQLREAGRETRALTGEPGPSEQAVPATRPTPAES